MKGLHRGEKGFTLIELLIVIAILGIIAAVVIPNAAGFMVTGTLNAANTEVQNVKTAAMGYMAENNMWPATSDDLTNYLSSVPTTVYSFDGDTGLIDDVGTTGYAADTRLDWCGNGQKWVRAGAACP